MSQPEVVPANTVIVQWICGGDCLEWSEGGGVEQVESYRVIAANVDQEKGRLTYDWLPIPPGAAGIHTEAVNQTIAQLGRTTIRQVNDMKIVGDSELSELRARGVDVIFRPPEE